MNSYYRDYGFSLEREQVVETVLGLPRFFCHRVVKRQISP